MGLYIPVAVPLELVTLSSMGSGPGMGSLDVMVSIVVAAASGTELLDSETSKMIAIRMIKILWA